MGWWKIDPETGQATREASKAKPKAGGSFLNAFPGVDDALDAHYLGDTPLDLADETVDQITLLLGKSWEPSHDTVRKLIFQNECEPNVTAEIARKCTEAIREFWEIVQEQYEEDWQRAPTAAERRWCGELIVSRLAKGDQKR